MDASVFHAGEQALQARAGLRERLESVGQLVIRNAMPDQHRELFTRLPTLLLAVQDDQGQPWATMLQGPAGFIASPDAVTLQVRARPADADPVAAWLAEGRAIGLLGIEPHTRRRNRANGQVRALREGGFDVTVQQSFGNCPKYIHARRPAPAPAGSPLPALRLGPQLDAPSVELLQRADTLYIASASAQQVGKTRSDGVDVSHRGGLPGFVRISQGPRGLRLTLPDYQGNFYFNTLGNLLAWGKAGLLVPDFDDGTMLQLAADASIEFDGPAVGQFPGAQRLLHLDLLAGWRRPQAMPLRWSAPQRPPQFEA